MDKAIFEKLQEHHQEHILSFYEKLPSQGQEKLEAQLSEIDWNQLDEWIANYVFKKPLAAIPADLSPAPYFPLNPETLEQEKLYAKATATGRELISSGKVAALTVAGGQGTRLGYDGPKGTYPIMPISQKTFFQYFAESVFRIGNKYGSRLNWYIMTSQLNDRATRDFFKANGFFNLAPDQVSFFMQGTMPAIGLDGKLLLEAKDSLALAPNGHGGTLLALRRSGALDRMRNAGVEYISYFQIDNPLVPVIDPLFLGLHHLENSEMSARMLAKTGPNEKLGNFCVSGKRMQIIEYSDMPQKLAEERDSSGKLRFIAGSPAIHIIGRSFVERLTEHGKLSLPWHRADKKVSFINAAGGLVKPDTPNAVKLESFIFDALPLASKALVLEACREEQFAPTKNPTGVDSVESCRAMLVTRDARRLEAAGLAIPRKTNGQADCLVELSPLLAVDDEDASAWVKKFNPAAPLCGERKYYG